MNTSSEFSDDFQGGCPAMDEDVLNYLSTLTPHQQKLLDEFVSINDHAGATVSSSATPQFASHYFGGRPMSMYEPFLEVNEFSSLPPDQCTPSVALDGQKFSWEAEDTEYIETLNEHQSADNFSEEFLYKPTFVMHTIADVHYNAFDEERPSPADVHIYATVQKPRKHPDNQMITSDRSVSDPPREKFPKIMTQSCYGELNNPIESVWNCYEQDLVQSMENIVEDGSHQVISSLMTDSSIIDGISSIDSSIYDSIQIPTSMTSSVEMQATMNRSTNSQRKIVKWWDDHREHEEESSLDLHGMAQEGKNKIFLSVFESLFRVSSSQIRVCMQK